MPQQEVAKASHDRDAALGDVYQRDALLLAASATTAAGNADWDAERDGFLSQISRLEDSSREAMVEIERLRAQWEPASVATPDPVLVSELEATRVDLQQTNLDLAITKSRWRQQQQVRLNRNAVTVQASDFNFVTTGSGNAIF